MATRRTAPSAHFSNQSFSSFDASRSRRTRVPSANWRDSIPQYEHGAAFQCRRPLLYGGAYTRIPVSAPRRLLLAPTLRGELLSPARACNKLSDFSENLASDSAHVLVRYGILTAGASNQTDRQARGYLSEDLRQREQMALPELSFLVALNQHLPLIPMGGGRIAFSSPISESLDPWAPTRRR